MNLSELKITNNDNLLFEQYKQEVVFDFSLNNNVIFETEENASILINLLNLKEDSSLDLVCSPNNKIHIIAILEKPLKNAKINVKVKQNCEINAFFADFSTDKAKAKFTFELLEPGASVKWHLASLSGKDNNKEFEVSMIHKAHDTYASTENYGVCKDNGRLVFSGVSSIDNGSYNSKTYQNAKIMVFDKKSIALAKPILKIDENDIEASHAAVVGEINEEHLFYLTSRGLTESVAKQLITYGYLKPIARGFKLDEDKETIFKLIEEKM